MPRTNLARTRDDLVKDGWVCDVAERWIPGANVRHDLFGWIDVIAIHPLIPGIRAIQVTSRSNMGEHLKKIQGLPAAVIWLRSGGTGEIWGWYKHKLKWMVKVQELELHGPKQSEQIRIRGG